MWGLLTWVKGGYPHGVRMASNLLLITLKKRPAYTSPYKIFFGQKTTRPRHYSLGRVVGAQQGTLKIQRFSLVGHNCKIQEECVPRRVSEVSLYVEVAASIFNLGFTQFHVFSCVLSNRPKTGLEYSVGCAKEGPTPAAYPQEGV